MVGVKKSEMCRPGRKQLKKYWKVNTFIHLKGNIMGYYFKHQQKSFKEYQYLLNVLQIRKQVEHNLEVNNISWMINYNHQR